MTTAAISPAGSATAAARRTLAVAALGTLLTLVAFTAPLATLNATAADLGADVAGRIWILSSMSIGLGAALLSAGTVADDLGRRRTFVAGAVGAGGWRRSWPRSPRHTMVFVLARVLQGVGGAAVLAAGLGLHRARLSRRPGPGRAPAGCGAPRVGAGIAVGPLLAAGLDRLADWRDAYWLLGAAALAVAVAAQLLVGESRAAPAARAGPCPGCCCSRRA